MSARDPHSGDDPHGDQPVAEGGADLADASAAVVCVHGRGATAQSMLQIAGQFPFDDVAYLAPQAAGRTWYPNPFTAPTESNQPGLRSGLAKVEALVDRAADAVGREHVVVLGFSQGACLGSEYVARNPTRYGGLVVFSGGLIGTEVAPEGYDAGDDGDARGALADTPAFVGCDDSDPHIDLERVHESTEVLEALGADVDERIYQGIGHGVVEDEIDAATAVLDAAREGED